MAGDREKYDVALNLKYKGLEFDGRYVDKEWDLPIGWSNALNEHSISPSKDYYLNLSYEANILEGLDLSGKVYRNFFEIANDLQVFPPGVILTSPTGFDIWEDGFLVESSVKTSRTGIDIQATYKMSDSNTVVSGATYEEQKAYDHTTKANYWPDPDTGYNIKLPSVYKWPDSDSEKRNFKAVFIEDIWDITDDIRFTIGGRYDRYSDFGGEFSPRAGLTWEYIKGYDLKLLYGHAFRAPSFSEIALKVPDSELDPETIDTYEVSLGADFTSSFSSRGTYYYRVVEDAITPTSTQAPWYWTNIPVKSRDHGFEIEAKYDFGRGTYLAGNYNYQSFAGRRNVGKVMSNIRLSRYLNLFADCQFYDGEGRWFADDDRDDLSGYAIVNATLIAKKFLKGFKGLELRGSVYNLLDKDYTYQQGWQVPNDMPMPGRHYMVEAKYNF